MTATVETAWRFFQIMRTEVAKLRRENWKHGRAVFLPGRWYPYCVQAWEGEWHLRRNALAAARSLTKESCE